MLLLMKLTRNEGESMFLMANCASVGMWGLCLMISGGEVLQGAHQREEALIVLGRAQLLELLHPGGEVGFGAHHLQHLEAFLALDDGGGAAIGHAEHADDGGDGAHPVQVLLVRLLDVGVLLAHHPEGLGAAVHVLDQADAAVASHRDRDHHPREKHGVAQGQDG